LIKDNEAMNSELTIQDPRISHSGQTQKAYFSDLLQNWHTDLGLLKLLEFEVKRRFTAQESHLP
jgi:hypothetical protein